MLKQTQQMNDNEKIKPYISNSIIKVKGSQTIYYLPCYVRIKMKNIKQMDLKLLCATLNATMLITIYYGNLPIQIAQQIQEKISIGFERDDTLFLGEKSAEVTSKIKAKDNVINFTVRKPFLLTVLSDVRYSPFQLLSLILTIKINQIQAKWLKNQDDRKIKIRFNLMDSKDNFEATLSCGKEGMKFGNYKLAEKLRKVHFTNISTYPQFKAFQALRENSQKQKQRPEKNYFNHVHFVISFYKFPGVALMVIFLPLLLLSIINLGVFFQNFTISERVESIAVLVIAFVAIFPVIRQQIPPIAVVTLIEIVVYWATFGSVFSLIQTFRVIGKQFEGYYWQQIALLYVCIIITAVTLLIICIFFIIHKCYWQKSYTDPKCDFTDKKLNMSEWNSHDENQEFNIWLQRCVIKQQIKKRQSQYNRLQNLGKRQETQRNFVQFYKVPNEKKIMVSKSFIKEENDSSFITAIEKFIQNPEIDVMFLQNVDKKWISNSSQKKIINLQKREVSHHKQALIKLSGAVLCEPKYEIDSNTDYTIIFSDKQQNSFGIIYKKSSFKKFYFGKKLEKELSQKGMKQILDNKKMAYTMLDDTVLISCYRNEKNIVASWFEKQITQKQQKQQKLWLVIGFNEQSKSNFDNQNYMQLQSKKMIREKIQSPQFDFFDGALKCKPKPKQRKDKK